MMSRFGSFPALMATLGLVALASSAAGSTLSPALAAPAAPSQDGGGAVAGASQRRIEGVWYRTPDERGKVAAFLASGDLVLGAGTISFESQKVSLSISPAGIKNVVPATQFPDDPANVWMVVEYAEAGSKKAAAFKDAGMGRGTPEIVNAIISTWLAGEPAPTAAPPQEEIASAIGELHSRRLESGTYDNKTVPGNVWKLVFTPGLDEALIRAYRAGDPDDVYRFNLVMILNRRTTSIEDEGTRERVRECLVDALFEDDFEWIRVESLDGLRRLAQVKDAIVALDGVMEGGREVEKRLAVAAWYAGTMKVPPLYLASQRGWNEIVKVLIGKGAAIEETAGAAGPGWTPLMIAAAEGREGAVKQLLGAGANPNAKNDLGRTPLMFASNYGFAPIVLDLLARGADPNAVPGDETGWTPLISASDKGHVETVQALLEGGADPALKDKSGRTALDHAKANDHSKVARLLKGR